MAKFTDRIDMRFKYIPAAKTDIRMTFLRIRRELREAEAQKVVPQVTQLKKREAK